MPTSTDSYLQEVQERLERPQKNNGTSLRHTTDENKQHSQPKNRRHQFRGAVRVQMGQVQAKFKERVTARNVGGLGRMQTPLCIICISTA